MHTFKINQTRIKEINKKVLIRTLPIMIIAVVGGVLISTINSKSKESDINVLPIMIPFIVAVVRFGLYRGLKKRKNLLESYRLTITGNLITRIQIDTATISIYINDIKEISRQNNGSLIIKGKNTGDLIEIPPQIDNYPELENILQQIQPIINNPKISFLEKYQSLMGLLMVGLMVCVYTVNNKIVVAIAGCALVSIIAWSFIKLQTSKNVDNKTKSIIWWLILVIASVITIIIFKLTGTGNMRNY